MNAALRTTLIVGAGLAGVGGLVVAFRHGSKEVKAEREVETPFSDIGANFMRYDANGDGKVDRKTEVVTFSQGNINMGPTYSSIRAVADAADMIVGNRDGFAVSTEFAALAATYTTRAGATGLKGNESSVFFEDYSSRLGDGGTPETMRGNPYM